MHAISQSKTTITFKMGSTFSHMLVFDYNDFLIDWSVTSQIFSNIFPLFSKTSRFHVLLGNSSKILSLVHTVIHQPFSALLVDFKSQSQVFLENVQTFYLLFYKIQNNKRKYQLLQLQPKIAILQPKIAILLYNLQLLLQQLSVEKICN